MDGAWQERPFVCTSCGYLSAQKNTLTAHIQRFHSGGQRLFKCELCLCAPCLTLNPLSATYIVCERLSPIWLT